MLNNLLILDLGDYPASLAAAPAAHPTTPKALFLVPSAFSSSVRAHFTLPIWPGTLKPAERIVLNTQHSARY